MLNQHEFYYHQEGWFDIALSLWASPCLPPLLFPGDRDSMTRPIVCQNTRIRIIRNRSVERVSGDRMSSLDDA